MILVANIAVEGAGFSLAGAAVCFVLLWWKHRNDRRLQAAEAQGVLERAKRDAESIIRDARLTANEEALKLREQTEQSFVDRRQQRAELEQRLGERETLLNAQLEKIVRAEKNLQEQKDGLQKQADSLAAQQRELEGLTRQRREQLQQQSHLTESEARTQFLKEIEQEAALDAGNVVAPHPGRGQGARGGKGARNHQRGHPAVRGRAHV